MCSGGPDYAERNQYEDDLMRMSEQMFNTYKESYVPLQNQMIEQVQGYRGPGYQQYAKDQGVNAARMNTPGTMTTVAGMDPSSGGFAQATMDAQNQSGHAGAMGAMSGLQTAEDQYMSGMLGMAQVGRGQHGDALQGTSSMAGIQAGQDMAEIAAKQYAKNQKWGAIGAIGGMTGMYYGDKAGWFNKGGDPNWMYKPLGDNPFAG